MASESAVKTPAEPAVKTNLNRKSGSLIDLYVVKYNPREIRPQVQKSLCIEIMHKTLRQH